MKLPKRSEREIQKAILDYLRLRSILAVRFNTGATAIPARAGKKARFIRYGLRGAADIICWPRPNEGDTWWLEVKRPGEKQSPAQIAFQKLVESHGHRYAVVTDLQDVMELVE